MTDIKYNTLDGVIVNKNVLLDVLRSNKEKHDAIYEVASSGFWIKAQEAVETKKDEFLQSINKAQTNFNIALLKTNSQLDNREKKISIDFYPQLDFSPSLGLSFPENHASDYNTIIRKLELSTAEEIKLSDSEFNCYVMNDWAWKKSFITTNSSYVNATTGSFRGGSGLIIGGYNNKIAGSVVVSGCSIF